MFAAPRSRTNTYIYWLWNCLPVDLRIYTFFIWKVLDYYYYYYYNHEQTTKTQNKFGTCKLEFATWHYFTNQSKQCTCGPCSTYKWICSLVLTIIFETDSRCSDVTTVALMAYFGISCFIWSCIFIDTKQLSFQIYPRCIQKPHLTLKQPSTMCAVVCVSVHDRCPLSDDSSRWPDALSLPHWCYSCWDFAIPQGFINWWSCWQTEIIQLGLEFTSRG